MLKFYLPSKLLYLMHSPNFYERREMKYKIEEESTYHNQIDLESVEPEFWKKKKLEDMNQTEWELLCDGCGKCCLNKLEIGPKIYFTCVRCRFLNPNNCLCRIYENRFEKVPDCRNVNLEAVRERPRWLPKTCAYWLLDNGKDLPDWHPLVSGSKDTVHTSFNSLRGRLLISESEVKHYEDYIVDWKDI